MKALIILGIIIFIYYQINKWYPFELGWNYHLYFYGFVIVYLLFYYLMSNQKPFVYKMLKNVQEVHDKPLYDIDSLSYKKNQSQGLKYKGCIGMEMTKRFNSGGAGNAKSEYFDEHLKEKTKETQDIAFGEPIWIWQK